EPTGDTILDTALEIVAKSAKHKKIQHWVSKVSSSCNKQKKILLDGMVDKGILKKLDDNDLPRFNVRHGVHGVHGVRGVRFKVWNDRPYRYILKQLHDALVMGKKPGDKTLRLLGLVRVCKLHRTIFQDKLERETALLKLDELTEGDDFKKAVKKTLNSGRMAVVSSVITFIPMILKEAC
ncbi:MAG: GPP34 family phosphoprotein, partial [bacterium]|nr:GPP34 family phosphoprotein [bacterium]